MRFCAVTLALVLLVPGFALGQSRPIDENVTYGHAQVLRATPVYETFRVRVPEQRCKGSSSRVAGTGRCRMVELERDERRLTGYDVEYQYKGEKYMSRLASDPGNRLRIRITITPDDPSPRYR